MPREEVCIPSRLASPAGCRSSAARARSQYRRCRQRRGAAAKPGHPLMTCVASKFGKGLVTTRDRSAGEKDRPRQAGVEAKKQKTLHVAAEGFRISHRVEEFSVLGRPGSD